MTGRARLPKKPSPIAKRFLLERRKRLYGMKRRQAVFLCQDMTQRAFRCNTSTVR
jgi:hypothetical protein